MNLKFCGCRACRRGKHTKCGGDTIKRIVRGARHKVNQMLHAGVDEEKIPRAVSVPYTD